MSYLYLTILFPLIGFVLLAAGRNKLPENVAAIIGVGAVGLSALFALIAGLDFVNNGKELYVQHLWTGSMSVVLHRASACNSTVCLY